MKILGRFSLILVIFSLILSACGQKQVENQASNQANQEKAERRMPDFGQPESQPEIRGLVSSITGNEVKVLKIERPQMNRQADNQDENDKENNKTLGMGTNNMGGGRMGGMGRNRGEQDENSEDQMIERMKEMSTGEETVTIPVGIQMLKPDTESDSKEPSMVEASLSDIEANIMISVWLNPDVSDRNIAKFVLIMN